MEARAAAIHLSPRPGPGTGSRLEIPLRGGRGPARGPWAARRRGSFGGRHALGMICQPGKEAAARRQRGPWRRFGPTQKLAREGPSRRGTVRVWRRSVTSARRTSTAPRKSRPWGARHWAAPIWSDCCRFRLNPSRMRVGHGNILSPTNVKDQVRAAGPRASFCLGPIFQSAPSATGLKDRSRCRGVVQWMMTPSPMRGRDWLCEPDSRCSSRKALVAGGQVSPTAAGASIAGPGAPAIHQARQPNAGGRQKVKPGHRRCRAEAPRRGVTARTAALLWRYHDVFENRADFGAMSCQGQEVAQLTMEGAHASRGKFTAVAKLDGFFPARLGPQFLGR